MGGAAYTRDIPQNFAFLHGQGRQIKQKTKKTAREMCLFFFALSYTCTFICTSHVCILYYHHAAIQKAPKAALNAETTGQPPADDIPRPLPFAGVVWLGASIATTEELGAAEGAAEGAAVGAAVGEAEGAEMARDPSDVESPVGDGDAIAEAVVVDAESVDVALSMDQFPTQTPKCAIPVGEALGATVAMGAGCCGGEGEVPIASTGENMKNDKVGAVDRPPVGAAEGVVDHMDGIMMGVSVLSVDIIIKHII